MTLLKAQKLHIIIVDYLKYDKYENNFIENKKKCSSNKYMAVTGKDIEINSLHFWYLVKK